MHKYIGKTVLRGAIAIQQKYFLDCKIEFEMNHKNVPASQSKFVWGLPVPIKYSLCSSLWRLLTHRGWMCMMHWWYVSIGGTYSPSAEWKKTCDDPSQARSHDRICLHRIVVTDWVKFLRFWKKVQDKPAPRSWIWLFSLHVSRLSSVILHSRLVLGIVGESVLRNILHVCMAVFGFPSSIGSAVGGAVGTYSCIFQTTVSRWQCPLAQMPPLLHIPELSSYCDDSSQICKFFFLLLVLIFRCDFHSCSCASSLDVTFRSYFARISYSHLNPYHC